MELKKHLDKRIVFIGLYVLAFVVYLVVGLQPVDAADYEISGELSIPEIGLTSDVAELQFENYKLDTPDTIVGSYTRAKNKTLLIGHSTTVFQNLKNVHLNSALDYNHQNYRVVSIDMIQKSNIDMNELLRSADRDTLVIMTCAGELLDDGDATHRLIITALAG